MQVCDCWGFCGWAWGSCRIFVRKTTGEDGSKKQRPPSRVAVFTIDYKTVCSACRHRHRIALCISDRGSSNDIASIVGGALQRIFQPLRDQIDHHIPSCTAVVLVKEHAPNHKAAKALIHRDQVLHLVLKPGRMIAPSRLLPHRRKRAARDRLTWLSQYRNEVVCRSGAVVSTNSMLSRKKGRQYGEGHQKTLQISIPMLPLVNMLVGGRERESCRASGPSAILGVCVSMPLLSGGWECVPLATRRRCRKECDGLSGYEAAEISSATLLLRWRLCRWRSHARLYIALCGVDTYTRYIQSYSRL